MLLKIMQICGNKLTIAMAFGTLPSCTDVLSFVLNYHHMYGKWGVCVRVGSFVVLLIICYDWVVEPPVHVHEVRLQVATLSGCSR